MKNRSFVLVAVFVGVLLALAVSAFAYDQTQKHEIAKGVSAGGVDIGGMSASQARQVLSERLAKPLSQPLVVRYGHRHFRLSAARAHLTIDVDGMVQAAVDKSRGGFVLTRAVREATGGHVSANVAPMVNYDAAAVARLVRRVQRGVDRPPQDATIQPMPDRLKRVPAKLGLAVRTAELESAIRAALVRPDGPRTVQAEADITKPKVTTAELASKYPTYIFVYRNARKLLFYKRLKLNHTYPIAVGMQGLETPAGLYHIQDKQVNPSWHVPNSAWAGKLAGKVIPPGPDDPIKARWMGFNGGAGIHGTAEVGSLGSAASHGCVRMAIPDVEQLYDQVDVGTPVYVA
jgi:lipoprotein-anchoring transpeptidase ErfK/SrfK